MNDMDMFQNSHLNNTTFCAYSTRRIANECILRKIFIYFVFCSHRPFLPVFHQMISYFNTGLEKILGDDRPVMKTSVGNYNKEIEEEHKFQNLLNEMNRSRDDVISDDELSLIVNRVGSDRMFKTNKIPTVSKKTEEELQRELRHIKGLLGVSMIL